MNVTDSRGGEDVDARFGQARCGTNGGHVLLRARVALGLTLRIEPPRQFFAAIAGWERILSDTRGRIGGAGQTNVKMMVVCPPWANLAQPSSVVGGAVPAT